MKTPTIVILCLAASISCSGCRKENVPHPEHTNQGDLKATTAFTDIAEEVGITFVHEAGFDPKNPKYLMPESMAGGAAMFDFDNDGDLDIYFINGAYTYDIPSGKPRPCNTLFRNDGGRFLDVTSASGLGDEGYGMGVAIGDIDNDGDEDVFITNVGPDAMYRNNGDGTFTNITKTSGISNDKWSSSTAFLDFDRDGFLDLFITNYLAYDPTVEAYDGTGRPEYPGPGMFRSLDDVLYRNRGDGTFEDVTERSGMTGHPGRGLGVACADFDDDGRIDIYVANDRDANRLWINKGDGTFEDRATRAGVAVNVFGQPEASMGIAIGDVYGDLDLDIFVTHIYVESNTLYQNLGKGFYEDRTLQQGLAAPSREFTGFGTAMLDYDHDGDLDLAIANGRVFRSIPFKNESLPAHWLPYAEPNLFFENDGSGRFRNISPQMGSFGTIPGVSRGLVTGDIDNDGDLDMLVTSGGGRAGLFRNDATRTGNWLIIVARNEQYKRMAEGAQITLSAGIRRFRRDVNRGFSYLCSGDPRVHFGLGDARRVDRIEVVWPDNTREVFPGVEANRTITLKKGTGTQ